MANLGSDDTPIVGESFGLPSGWALTENDDGEIVIEDSGGNAVFRRDETAGEWVTDSIDAESVSVGSGTIGQEATSPDEIVRLSQLGAFQDLIVVESADDLPELQEATFAYVEEEDDYAGVFKI